MKICKKLFIMVIVNQPVHGPFWSCMPFKIACYKFWHVEVRYRLQPVRKQIEKERILLESYQVVMYIVRANWRSIAYEYLTK